jgi:hypothetical protein
MSSADWLGDRITSTSVPSKLRADGGSVNSHKAKAPNPTPATIAEVPYLIQKTKQDRNRGQQALLTDDTARKCSGTTPLGGPDCRSCKPLKLTTLAKER